MQRRKRRQEQHHRREDRPSGQGAGGCQATFSGIMVGSALIKISVLIGFSK
jgi:hypothetical protein